jgi:hypothetical protein
MSAATLGEFTLYTRHALNSYLTTDSMNKSPNPEHYVYYTKLAVRTHRSAHNNAVLLKQDDRELLSYLNENAIILSSIQSYNYDTWGVLLLLRSYVDSTFEFEIVV